MIEEEEREKVRRRNFPFPTFSPFFSFPPLISSIPFLVLILFSFLLFSSLLFSPPQLLSQLGPHLLFRTLSIEQGLSQNSVLSITCDHHGFLWFGTESGLNKFDGYKFTVYLPVEGNPRSLSNSWINALLTDRLGTLWVGTENGLNQYLHSRDEFIRYFHDPTNPNSLSSSRIFCLYEDRDGRLWVGTDSGLNLFDPPHNRFIRYQHDPANPSATLSSDNIRAIAQDSTGFIWVGTVGGGLNRLDPATGQVTQFRASDGVSADANRKKSASSASSSQSSPHSKSSKSSSSTKDPSVANSLPDDTILALLIAPQQTSAIATPSSDIIWLGTNSSGLVRFDPASNEFKVYQHQAANPTSLSDNSVNCLFLDPDGTIWAGTNAGGLNHFYPAREVFIPYLHQAVDPFSLADNRVVSLYLAPDRILWVGTYRGISQLNLHRQNFLRFLSNPADPSSLFHPEVRAFCDSSSGLFWVGTDGGGLTAFDRRKMHTLHYRHIPGSPNSLSSDRVFSIVEDRDGTIWIGTYGGGLNHFNPKTNTFTHYRSLLLQPGSLVEDRIRSLFIDSHGRLWVGTDGSGLVSYDRQANRFTRAKVAEIIITNENNELSTAPESMLIPYNSTNSTDSPNPPSSEKKGMSDSTSTGPSLQNSPSSSTRKDSIWASPEFSNDPQAAASADSSPNPSNSPNPPNSPNPSNPLLDGRIFSITEDKSGYLWIGCYGDGLVRYHPESGQLLHLTHNPLNPKSLSSNSVINVYVSPSGSVWVGTNGGGLNCLDPVTLTFTRYTESQGLPSSVIYGILEDDDGYLWFSSNRGLSRLDPRTGQIRNFDTTDGLQSYEFNGNACLKGRDGFLYFGGINGFNAFNPKEIKTSDYRPPVVLTSFFISNIPIKPGQSVDGKVVLERSISETDSLELFWKHRVIAFEFAGLDYTSPEKNQYAYILEGFEKDWNYVGTRRFASYSNLPPGRYTFRVKASNSDGLWNETGASLSLRIIPPFWRTWWFYLLEMFVVAGALYGLYKYRLNRIRHRQQELERLVAQRTDELKLANEKLRLLAITDELTGLANYRRFRDFLEYEWRRAHRSKKPVSLIIADLDDFKLFNDTYGHQAGDECLKQVALLMLKCCQRSSDLVCRYGGDEFAVVLPETDTAGAFIVAERIRELVARIDLRSLNFRQIREMGEVDEGRPKSEANHQPWKLTVCLGCATMNPVEGGNTNELIAKADQALYQAKSSGKNRTRV